MGFTNKTRRQPLEAGRCRDHRTRGLHPQHFLSDMTQLQSGIGMQGGPENPIGARALYLWQGNKDTLYRIHGTNEPWTIGHNVSSGCIRLTNDDVVDLYERAPVGAKVHVLPSGASER